MRPLMLALVLACAALPVSAQMAGKSVEYDLTKMKPHNVTVLAVRPSPLMPEQSHEVVVNIEGKEIGVTIGPLSWSAKKGITFAKGDEITVHGYIVTIPGFGPLMRVQKIVKGEQTLPLKDDQGRWVWMMEQ